MPRKPTTPLIQCTFFSWRLLCRDGVFYADGRQAKLGKHSLGSKDREEALHQLSALDLAKAVELGIAVPRQVNSNDLSIDQGWQHYLDFSSRAAVMGGASTRTVKRYTSVRDHHLRFCNKLGVVTWRGFEKRHLEKFGNARSQTQAYRTVYFEVTVVKSVNKWLIEEGLLAQEARLSYRLQKPKGTDTYCYSPEQLAAIIELCQSSDDLQWLADVVLVLAHTGMRISEAAQLRWSDVDLVNGVIRVADERTSRRKQIADSARTTKGRRSRNIPLHSQLRRAFTRFTVRPDGYVLHAPRGGRLLPRNVLTAFIRDVIKPLTPKFPTAVGEIGFEHGRIHSFRHFFCSVCLIAGASEGEVREWLGHADSKMVEHYRHLRAEDARRRMDQIHFLPGGFKRPSTEQVHQGALPSTDSGEIENSDKQLPADRPELGR